MHRRCAAVANLTLALQAALSLETSVNMYHTPLAEQAFAMHYDPTEVLVLQLAGEKNWSFFEPVVTLPRNADAKIDPLPLPATAITRSKTVTMRPGDMLFFPRGMLHYARNEGAPASPSADAVPGVASSTHLTIGLAVHFYQTVEAAVHILLMREWRLGMRAETGVGEPHRTALNAQVHMVRDPSDNTLMGLPAYLLLHAAIRNAANADVTGAWRRAVLFASKGNASAATLAFAEICTARPTVHGVLDGMRLWETGGADGGTATTASVRGLGTIESTLRDLDALKLDDTHAKTQADWQALGTAHTYAAESLGRGGPIDGRMSAAQVQAAEATFARAWDALCPPVAELHGKARWSAVLRHIGKLLKARRARWHRGWVVDPAVKQRWATTA